MTTLPNTPPTIDGVSVPEPSEGTPFTLSGSFIDPDPHEAWTLTLDWGDELDAQRATTASPAPQVRTFTAVHPTRRTASTASRSVAATRTAARPV